METDRNKLVVIVGVKDVEFGERKYKAIANLTWEDVDNTADLADRSFCSIGGDHYEGLSTTIDDLAKTYISDLFFRCRVKEKSEIDAFPIHNFGSDNFDADYRQFSDEELSFLRERIHHYVNKKL